MNEKQQDIRKIWAVLVLLDGKEKTQTEIETEINGIDDRICAINKKLNENFSKGMKKELKNRMISKEEERLALKGLGLFQDFKKISFKSTSKTEIFGSLEKEGIIKRRNVPVENSNLIKKLCWIPEETETLSKITNLIVRARIEPNRRYYFTYILISSKLGKKILKDVLSSLPEELNNLKPSLNEKELEVIKTLMSISSNCYTYVTNYIRRKTINAHHNKNIFLLELQAIFASDIAQSRYVSAMARNKIELKISLNLKEKDIETEDNMVNISVDSENDTLKTKLEFIPSTKELSFDALTYRYLRDSKFQKLINVEK